MTVTVLESQLPLVDAPPSSSSPLRSGSSRRSILVADRATCDLHVLGLDGRLRVWSQHEATLRCVRTLAPAVVPPQLAANPGAFWRHPSRTQAQLVADASGGSVAAPSLPPPLMRDPLELLAPTTPGEGRLMAVVGAAGVGVLALPADGTPGRRAAAASSDEVCDLLGRLGLGRFAAPLKSLGYESLTALHALSPEERRVRSPPRRELRASTCSKHWRMTHVGARVRG